jgi:methionyl-tRNA formyltransferase
LNVHTSLLPRHRGAAPIQWAILSGDPETGVTIMKMDAGLDTGPILTQRKTPVLDSDTAETLHDRLAEGATYARKIEKADGLVNWEEPASQIWRKLRAFTPWPGAFTFLETEGRRRMIKLWEAYPAQEQGTPGRILSAGRDGILVAAGEGALRIVALQPEGKKRMTAQEFLAGNAVTNEQVFTR